MKVIQTSTSGSIQLTPHFYLSEFTDSAIAERHGLNNSPDPLAVANIYKCAELMERIRALLGGRAIFVSSGFRSLEVNQAAGGSVTSDHLRGEAVDFVCRSFGTPLQVAEAIRKSGIPFGQLIYEGTWVHISLPNRGTGNGQVMTAKFIKGQKTQYLQGLVA